MKKVLYLALFALLAPTTNAGNQKDFFQNTAMTSSTNYNPAGLPTNTDDVRITRTSTTGLTITAATLTMESLNALNGNSYTISNATSTATNSTLSLGNSANFSNAFSGQSNDLIFLTGNSNLTIQGANSGSGTGTLSIALAVTGNFDIDTGSALTVTSVISGSFSLGKSGGGTLVLSGANTFSGGSNFLNFGTIAIGSSGVVNAGGTIASGPLGTGPIGISGGTLRSDSTSARSIQNSLVFSGNITLGNPTNNGTLTFTSTDGTNTLSTAATISLLGTATLTTLSPVSIVDNITQQFPSSGITKGGASTLTISGTNNYTGATTVSAGTLLVNNATGSGTGSGAVAVNGGILGGNGFIVASGTNNITINGGGTITGGNNGTVATLSLQSVNVAFAGALNNLATYLVDLNSITSDKLAIIGSLNLGTAFDQISFQGTTGASSYQLVTYSGSLIGTFNNVTALPTGYILQYNVGEIDLVATAVPEPGTWLAGALALGALGFMQRRRLCNTLKR